MRQSAIRSAAIALWCVQVAGCGKSVNEADVSRLRVGMTPQEVEGILGKDGKEVSPNEVATLMREALTPKLGPDGKPPANAPKVELPDLTGVRGVRWGDDKKSVTVVFTGNRVTRIFKKGF
jgi:hypothetical protein